MHKVLAHWSPDVIADEVVVRPADLKAEAQANQWSFSVTADENASLSVEDLEEFILAVVRSRSEGLSRRGVSTGTLTFYCWCDPMVFQLRFSIISAERTGLPFGCRVSDAKLPQVLSEFLGRAVAGEAIGATFRLGVWSISIP